MKLFKRKANHPYRVPLVGLLVSFGVSICIILAERCMAGHSLILLACLCFAAVGASTAAFVFTVLSKTARSQFDSSNAAGFLTVILGMVFILGLTLIIDFLYLLVFQVLIVGDDNGMFAYWRQTCHYVVLTISLLFYLLATLRIAHASASPSKTSKCTIVFCVACVVMSILIYVSFLSGGNPMSSSTILSIPYFPRMLSDDAANFFTKTILIASICLLLSDTLHSHPSSNSQKSVKHVIEILAVVSFIYLLTSTALSFDIEYLADLLPLINVTASISLKWIEADSSYQLPLESLAKDREGSRSVSVKSYA